VLERESLIDVARSEGDVTLMARAAPSIKQLLSEALCEDAGVADGAGCKEHVATERVELSLELDALLSPALAFEGETLK
jgi:hypothetical protein